MARFWRLVDIDANPVRRNLDICGTDFVHFAAMKINLPALLIALLLSACQTTTQTTNRINVGMTKADVLRSVGAPFSKSAAVQDGVTVEKWIYKETTWDQGGWSWNRTVSDSAVVFKNGRVVS